MPVRAPPWRERHFLWLSCLLVGVAVMPLRAAESGMVLSRAGRFCGGGPILFPMMT